MSFTLIDLSSENFEFQANVWNWKALLEVVKSFDILDDGRIRQMGYNAMGIKVEPSDAHTIGQKIRDELLPKLEPNKRIYADLSAGAQKMFSLIPLLLSISIKEFALDKL